MRTKIIEFFAVLLTVSLVTACSNDSGDPNKAENGGVQNTIDSSSLLTGIDSIGPFSPNSLLINNTIQLYARGQNSQGNNIDLSSVVSWTSSNDAIVSVSNNGLVSALHAGSVEITATWDQPGNLQITSIGVTVKNGSLIINENSRPLFVNDHYQFTTSASFTDGGYISTTKGVAWSVSDNSVASINELGEFQAKAPGAVTVLAQFYGLQSELTLTINPEFIVTASNIGLFTMTFDWTAFSQATSYDLEIQGPNVGTFLSKEIINLSETHFLHSNLNSGTQYHIVVTAYLQDGTKLTSNVLVQNTLPNNSATLAGPPIGPSTPRFPVEQLRAKVNVSSPSPKIDITSAYILRTDPNYPEVFSVVMKANYTASVGACSIFLDTVDFLDVNSNVLVSASVIAVSGDIKDSTVGVSKSFCFGPGQSAYFEGAVLAVNAAPMAFESITDISPQYYLAFDSAMANNLAVLPVNYTVSNIPNSSYQTVEVEIENMGSAMVKIDTYSNYLLLDQDGLPLDTGVLQVISGWDGLLDVGQRNKLTSVSDYRGERGNKLYVVVNFGYP